MARVQLTDPATLAGAPDSDLGDFIAKLRQGRRGTVLNIYRMLLNSPKIAKSWFAHLNTVRWGTGLDGRLRELVIIRIAHLTGAAYVIRQHVPKLALADGVSEAECAALQDWQGSPFFDARERAVLAYTDAMTRDIKVSDEIFADVRPHFDDAGLVELSVLIGTYNMHVRVLQALDIDLEPDD
jgi:alkylhydroperoxidase family enzyme